MPKSLIILIIILLSNYCSLTGQDFSAYGRKQAFTNIYQLKQVIDSIGNLPSQLQREKGVNSLWDELTLRHQIPFSRSDSVIFLYKGKAQRVAWAGDFNGWNPEDTACWGIKAGKSDIWYMEKEIPVDARLDYKIIVNKEWILDPANPYIQYSGFGPNSELRMPAWVYPLETISHKEVPHGTLSEFFYLRSNKENLNYKIQYKVYLPYSYKKLQNLQVVYLTDGQEYSETLQGGMIETMDNLIFEGKIKPIIAVFIDPRNPDTLSTNRRMNEYRENQAFLRTICKELIPHIDSSYRTISNPDARIIMGASLGGWNAAWFGLKRPDVFHLIAIQSPAFTDDIIKAYADAPLLPLKIFMSTGTIHDTRQQALSMKKVFESKNYTFKYLEVNQGHSWGSWRAQIDTILIYFCSPSMQNN
jgi:enterochelin esterase-like enzyme